MGGGRNLYVARIAKRSLPHPELGDDVPLWDAGGVAEGRGMWAGSI